MGLGGEPVLAKILWKTYFRHEPPIDSSSLTPWRQRVGEEGVEWQITETIEAALRGKEVKRQSFDKIIIDTTVMEKAVAYSTDSRLLERARQHLVVVGMHSMPDNPYDGHTLPGAVEQISILTAPPKVVFVDKGYRGVAVAGVTISKTWCHAAIKKAIHRRRAIESAVGHMKNGGRLRRNWLKGSLADFSAQLALSKPTNQNSLRPFVA